MMPIVPTMNGSFNAIGMNLLSRVLMNLASLIPQPLTSVRKVIGRINVTYAVVEKAIKR